MKDPEVIELRNRFFFGVVVCLIFAIPLIMFLNKNLGNHDSDVYKMIKDKESFVVFVEDNKCNTCDGVKEVLDGRRVSYFIMNIDKTDDYFKITDRLGINRDEVVTPGIIYIDAGELRASVFDIKNDEEINEFVDLNKIQNTK